MAAFTALYPLVRLFAKNCPEATIDLAVRAAYMEFCSLTWWWREVINLPLEEDIAYFDLTPADDTNSSIIGVVAVQNSDGKVIFPITQQLVPARSYIPKGSTYAFVPPDTIEIISPYEPGDTIPDWYVEVALSPTPDTSVIHDSVMQEHDYTIAAGAIAYLCEMPQEAWTNDKLADKKYKEFIMGCRTAKSDRMFGKTGWNAMVQLRQFDL